jgi:glycosyltransferase involved in cell wall biosynthesis
MTKRKVLYICHNHPSVRPGGAEAYALELYEAMRASDEFEPIFLAKGGPPVSMVGRLHGGTFFSPINGDSNQYFVYTDGYEFDWLFGTIVGKDFYAKHFHEFLLAFQPDIVHFQHTLFLGYDLIREVRNTLPDAPIVYTLHEYLPICHRQGQMVRLVNNEEVCTHSSPRRCHECFPHISPQSFFMRQRFIQSQFSLVDLFLAPSHFLLERYVDWGIPPEKIRDEEYGRLPVWRTPESLDERPRNRFGFFGQFTPFKGVQVLLEAMKILAEAQANSRPTTLSNPFRRMPSVAATTGSDDSPRGEAHLWLHGANLDLQPGVFQTEFQALIEATKQNVTLVGRYDHDQLPRLMANIDWVVVPSIWWENSPLVIQEAFMHGKPVICSDIGGMAEKVTHDVNGLHFRTRDPFSLAETIRQATTTPGLWERLRSGVPQVHKMEEHVAVLSDIYRTLLDQKKPAMVAHQADPDYQRYETEDAHDQHG